MLGFFRGLKDPWRLLVVALAVANVIAVAAVVMMLRNRNEAKTALAEAQRMLQAPTPSDGKKDAVIFKEVRDLAKIRALTRNAELESTSVGDVRKFIHKWANAANLPIDRQIPHKEQVPRKGFKDHIWTLIFNEKEPNLSREQLAFFLYNIKAHLPQLKIRSITSGSSRTEAEKADHWRPQVEFVLTKEEG